MSKVKDLLVESQTLPIVVGKGGPLVVETDPIDQADVGMDVAFGDILSEIRRPRPTERFKLDRSRIIRVSLYQKELEGDGYEKEYFYVDKTLQGAVREYVRPSLVVPFMVTKTRKHGLWVVGRNPRSSWYNSLRKLFEQPPEFYRDKSAIVTSDRDNRRYQIRVDDDATVVEWPEQSTEVRFSEAIGPDNFITSADHEEYKSLLAGYIMK